MTITKKSTLFIAIILLYFPCTSIESISGYDTNTIKFTQEELLYIKKSNPIEVFIIENNYRESYYENLFKECSILSGLDFHCTPINSFNRIKDLSKTQVLIPSFIQNAQIKISGFTESDIFYISKALFVPNTKVPSKTDSKTVSLSDCQTVGILDTSDTLRQDLTTVYPTIKWILYKKETVLLNAVSENRIDAALFDKNILTWLYSLHTYKGLDIESSKIISSSISFSVKNSEKKELLSILNKCFFHITKSEKVASFSPNRSTQNTIERFILYSKTHKDTIPIIISSFIIIFMINFIISQRIKLAKMDYDEISGLWSMQKFAKKARSLLEDYTPTQYALIFLDFFDFKFINTIYGRTTGDIILKEFGALMKKELPRTCYFCRDMADHFYILSPLSDESDIAHIKYLIDPSQLDITTKLNLNLIIKAGVSLSSEKINTLDRLIENSILAKAKIKDQHSKDIAFFDTEIAAKKRWRRIIETKMEAALINDDFIVYYQPKIDLTTEEIIGAEALVRWVDAELGLITPDKFIPIFEANGFIRRLDFYVYEKVFSAIQWHIEKNLTVPIISVNMSRAHLSSHDYPQRLSLLSKKYNVPPHHIEIELTESEFTEKAYMAQIFTKELKKKGFSISIDDFGTGYSSFSQLSTMTVDVLKIDKSFIDTIETSKKARIILGQIISLAKALSIKTICEGVETKEQVEILRNLKCDAVQGFYFSPPLAPEELKKYIIKYKSHSYFKKDLDCFNAELKGTES